MTIEELANELQEVYNQRIAELEEENDNLERDLRWAKAYKEQRDKALDRIATFLSQPWWMRIFNTKPLTDPNFKNKP